MVAPAMNPMMQLAAQCRIEPLVFEGFCPELCPALEQVILQHAQTDRSTKSLNVGGWKSGEDFFLWPDAAIQELRQRIADDLGLPRIVGWAMVNRGGSSHPRHQHRAAALTGIYYVNPGSEDAITPTIFECLTDPRTLTPQQRAQQRGKPSTYNVEIEPHPGRLAICRGEQWHSVPPYPGDLPRITIAFDVRR